MQLGENITDDTILRENIHELIQHIQLKTLRQKWK